MRPGIYGAATNRAKKPFVAFPKEYYHIFDLRVTKFDWENLEDDGFVKLGPMELISWEYGGD